MSRIALKKIHSSPLKPRLLRKPNKRMRVVKSALQEKTLRAIFDHCFEFVGLMDPSGKLIEINQAPLKLGNLQPADVLGKPFWDIWWWTHIVTPEGRFKLIESWERVRHGEFARFDVSGMLPNGEWRTIDFSLSPIFNKDGSLQFVVPEGRDITDFKKLQSDLEEANEKLRQANSDLEDFAHTVSHDLRQPLEAVHMNLELLRTLESELSPDAKSMIQAVTDGTQRLMVLLRSILNFSIATRQCDMRERVDCSVVAREVIQMLSHKANAIGAKIEVNSLPTIQGNRAQILRLFQNLFSNALKFKDPHRPLQISISAKQEKCFWNFSVCDTGIGIEKFDQKKLFKIFSRLHSHDNHYPGTGLGLAISKKIIERHNGKIWVESEVGKGTTFHFCLKSIHD